MANVWTSLIMSVVVLSVCSIEVTYGQNISSNSTGIAPTSGLNVVTAIANTTASNADAEPATSPVPTTTAVPDTSTMIPDADSTSPKLTVPGKVLTSTAGTGTGTIPAITSNTTTTTVKQSPASGFDLGSFFGGFILCAAIVAIIYFGCKMFRGKKPDYNTL